MRRISPTTFRIARRGTSREINRQIALNLVRANQPLSRADLARLMGVRRGAISLLVNELLRSGLVFEGAKGESKRGRKPMNLHIETRRRCAVAVDISASRTLIFATDLLGHPLLEVSEFPTRRRPQALVKDLAQNIGDILAKHREVGECVGVGVVVSGLVDPLAIIGIVVLVTLVWLHPARRGATFMPVKAVVLLLAAPLIVGAVAFAGAELQIQLAADAADPHAALGHYGALAALAATIVSAVIIGSSSLPGSTLSGWLGVAAAVAFGVASVVFPAAASRP